MVSFFKYFQICFLQRLNIISSTLVNTDINLQLPYYTLEFQENVFSRTSEPRGLFRTMSNIYDEACNRVLFRQKLRHRFLTGPEYPLVYALKTELYHLLP